MNKALTCPKCGGELVEYGTLKSFLTCLVCGLVVNKDAAEAHAAGVDDGKA